MTKLCFANYWLVTIDLNFWKNGVLSKSLVVHKILWEKNNACACKAVWKCQVYPRLRRTRVNRYFHTGCVINIILFQQARNVVTTGCPVVIAYDGMTIWLQFKCTNALFCTKYICLSVFKTVRTGLVHSALRLVKIKSKSLASFQTF